MTAPAVLRQQARGDMGFATTKGKVLANLSDRMHGLLKAPDGPRQGGLEHPIFFRWCGFKVMAAWQPGDSGPARTLVLTVTLGLLPYSAEDSAARHAIQAAVYDHGKTGAGNVTKNMVSNMGARFDITADGRVLCCAATECAAVTTAQDAMHALTVSLLQLRPGLLQLGRSLIKERI